MTSVQAALGRVIKGRWTIEQHCLCQTIHIILLVKYQGPNIVTLLKNTFVHSITLCFELFSLKSPSSTFLPFLHLWHQSPFDLFPPPPPPLPHSECSSTPLVSVGKNHSVLNTLFLHPTDKLKECEYHVKEYLNFWIESFEWHSSILQIFTRNKTVLLNDDVPIQQRNDSQPMPVLAIENCDQGSLF